MEIKEFWWFFFTAPAWFLIFYFLVKKLRTHIEDYRDGESHAVFAAYGTPDEKQIAELSVGEIVGETGLLDRVARTATAVALDDDTVLLEIREENLKDYFLKEPEKLLLLMRNLSGRLREINSKLADVCRKIYEGQNA